MQDIQVIGSIINSFAIMSILVVFIVYITVKIIKKITSSFRLQKNIRKINKYIKDGVCIKNIHNDYSGIPIYIETSEKIIVL